MPNGNDSNGEKRWRSRLMFAGGFIGAFLHLAVYPSAPIAFLALWAAMMGLPIALWKDNKDDK